MNTTMERTARLGSEVNPIPVSTEHPYHDTSALEFGERPYLWIVSPSGQLTKCYRSYSDYCD